MEKKDNSGVLFKNDKKESEKHPDYKGNITVELDGQTVGGAIRDGQINDSLSGSFNQVNRGQGFKGAVAL